MEDEQLYTVVIKLKNGETERYEFLEYEYAYLLGIQKESDPAVFRVSVIETIEMEEVDEHMGDCAICGTDNVLGWPT